MVSMVLPVTLTPDTNLDDLREAIMKDDRWKVAQNLGARELRVLANTDDATDAIIETRWNSVEGAKSFLDSGVDSLVKGLRPTGRPKILSARNPGV